MSLFKKPKKNSIQRRIFSSENNDSENVEKMDIDDDYGRESKKTSSNNKEKKPEKKEKDKSSIKPPKLLSFNDEEGNFEELRMGKIPIIVFYANIIISISFLEYLPNSLHKHNIK